jgi:hypothetical protein
MSLRTDVEQHRLLVEELVIVFRQLGYRILGADGVEGLPRPKKLHNDGYGDQRDKMPDVYAFDEKERRYIIGEAKTGKGDLETEHALTQYNVFLDQFDRSTGRQALMYIILPESKIPEFNSLITHYIHRDYWHSIVVVRSKRWKE